MSFSWKLQQLQREEWFHGCLPFEDIVGLLKKDGDFLLRELEPEGDRSAMACVTVRWGPARDFPVHCMNVGNLRIYTINGEDKNTRIMDLVRFHHSTGTPVGEDVKLQHPIPKQPWELSSDKINLVEKIGAGAFGEVWKGTMSRSQGKPPTEVAIKVMKVNDENKDKMDEMYKEARLMRQARPYVLVAFLNSRPFCPYSRGLYAYFLAVLAYFADYPFSIHCRLIGRCRRYGVELRLALENIVTFYGIVQKSSDSVMIVMEMVNGGGLDHHLRKNPNISVKEKISYAIDVAVGLVYLHSKGCMHRDIACRNCLIDVKKTLVKISDFGLSKQAESYTIKSEEKLPIRWQAPEVITTRIYTRKCDVYSYGILLWEIFNNAEKPYAGINNRTIRENITDPKFRPVVDVKWPIVVQRAMRACWRGDSKKRPEMQQVARYLMFAPPEL
ncbi:unnamed protein product [Strongylus vulgaris]|uniref:Tyrosine-protein kinase n=1 Tax=Strongylus vulgaris TaxID=40348 RepID=A0A3P7I8G8_STRVU|nr:unnamed protein product [Strongylus vulgaris]